MAATLRAQPAPILSPVRLASQGAPPSKTAARGSEIKPLLAERPGLPNKGELEMKRGERAQLWRANDGVGAIEFAFVAGILAVMLLGVLDFGIGFWEKMQVNNAVQAGAEYATKSGYDSANIETAITNATGLGAIQASPAPSQGCGCPNAATG